MVFKRTSIKRKRKTDCTSPLLEESPKRIKVHAQRKFAQGSNVNSPVITPIKELESEGPQIDVLPEPMELLPIKRPNTEDFLTFLCFRGTPILPPSLNFFNTASIVDTNGQVHEIKSECSPKNGPIDIAKCSSSAQKPFIAFGVRKRADPIVISRQMDRKRRHALAIQALRRKYQEQKMAKIRALTISKLSEKVTNKTLFTNKTVSKTETVTKKTTLDKTKVVATKHIKVMTLKTTLRPKIKPKMCLRSFRGKFEQKELPFRKNIAGSKIIIKTIGTKIKTKGKESRRDSLTEKELKISSRSGKMLPLNSKSDLSPRITRSGRTSAIITLRRQHIKKRILLPATSSTTVKPRSLRSTTIKKTVLSRRKSKTLQAKQKLKTLQKKSRIEVKLVSSEIKKSISNVKKLENKKPCAKNVEKKEVNKAEEKETISDDFKKIYTRSVDKKTASAKISPKELKKPVVEKNTKDIKTESQKIKKDRYLDDKKKIQEMSDSGKKPAKQPDKTIGISPKREDSFEKASTQSLKLSPFLKDAMRKEFIKREMIQTELAKSKNKDLSRKKEELVKKGEEAKACQRPSRKTKEAAAIYMELLSHKLVNDNKIDDEDNVSIDSFPELPNVKKTEQRENELKAQAKSTTEAKEKPKEREKNFKEAKEEKTFEEKLVKENKIKVLQQERSKETKTKREQIPDDVSLSKLKNYNKKFIKIEKSKGEKTKLDDKKRILLGNKKLKPKIEKSESEDEVFLKKSKKVDKKTPGKEKKTKIELKKDNSYLISESKQNSDEKISKNNEQNPVNVKDKKPLRKTVDKSLEKEVLKRQIKNLAQVSRKRNDLQGEDNDSDESFYAIIKVPRRRKVTRSKAKDVKTIEEDFETKSNKNKQIDGKTVDKAEGSHSSSHSDRSTTSDVNLQTLANKSKNKKDSKKNSKKISFSDSDEEPLSKLTNKSTEGSHKEKEPLKRLKSSVRLNLMETEEQKMDNQEKPKRECAKRPQNYLPMFSSSDEDIFHGFDEKAIEIKTIISLPEKKCTHTSPLQDLLSKEVRRRHGKEKVNMSNEQIEKWLKESALAGSSIKKENDQMLKFGERIPTETSLQNCTSINTSHLKTSLLEVKRESIEKNIRISENYLSKSKTVDTYSKDCLKSKKPFPIDRKLIFKKDKKDTRPNVNAFSPENESSVYAFGEETDEAVSTPFRRPSRRPSSTATSRSEDESSKHDDSSKFCQFRKPTIKDSLRTNRDESDTGDESYYHFYAPREPSKGNLGKNPTQGTILKQKSDSKSKITDPDEFKYKIPSSPEASSSSSAKLSKKNGHKMKKIGETIITAVTADFPKKNEPAKLVKAPVFYPTDQEFQDPLEYIERIRARAERFGLCRIVPPASFKPECKVMDDMRFTAYNQYVNKMLHRWGPNFKELMAIKKYLGTQNIALTRPPWIGGMEIDLPRLYQTVQTLGGLKEVIEKKKWPRVSEMMKIPKSAQDRVTKLDDIYCKYLLPYDTLSSAEREKLFDEVETDWAKKESKSLLKAQQKTIPTENDTESDPESDLDDEAEECITRGRNMALSAFYRIARNTMSVYFKTTEPTAQEVEIEYWKHVTQRQFHICVNSGSIDSGNWGYGFAVSKNSPFARHAWNLKILTNNSGSVLRSLGPLMGVTVPTLHVGMVFSSCCWYRDPHGLPWIEYLHTGGNKIWYAIPDSTGEEFRSTIEKIVPNYCRNKELWLPSDTAMVPPNILVENNVSLSRAVQEPGQFVVVFPKAFTSSISTGYVVSESVYFAPPYWLKTARNLFDSLRNSCEPSMFSLDRLLLSVASDTKSNADVLRQILPYVEELCNKEQILREKLQKFGTMEGERMPLPDSNKKKRRQQGEEGDYECEVCRMNLFVSMVFNTRETTTYCLDHAIDLLETDKMKVKDCKFMFSYDEKELKELPEKIKVAIKSKMQKKVPGKFAGMPTLLNN